MPDSFKRHFPRDKETKQLLAEIQRKLKVNIQQLIAPEARLELAESKTLTLLLINEKPLFARKEEMLLPTLAFDDILKSLPRVVVNMGAVPHICNGADVMAPGIVAVKGNFGKEDFVVVVDERYQKPLAVCLALFDSQALKDVKQGKTLRNVHWVGDDLWQMMRKL